MRRQKNPGKKAIIAAPIPYEHDIQAAFVRICRLHENIYPALRLMFAVPNGQKRDIRIARILQAEGARPGVPDIILPAARHGHHGFAIEFKRPGEKPTKTQIDYHALMIFEGWKVEVHTDADRAWQAMRSYLSDSRSGMIPAILID